MLPGSAPQGERDNIPQVRADTMLRLSNLKTNIHTNTEALLQLTAKKLRVPPNELTHFKIAKKSIDSRDRNNIRAVYSVDFTIAQTRLRARILRDRNVSEVTDREYCIPASRASTAVSASARPVIVGAGPAGLFAANVLAMAGLAPVVLERGQTVAQRSQDVEDFLGQRILHNDSNVQFGEGGAGTFSDGKLTTGIRDERIGFVLRTLVECGAPHEITYLAKPHIGTDKLASVVGNLRSRAEALGAQFIFGAKFYDFETAGGRLARICYVDAGGQAHYINTPALLLAIGHSARDTVETLFARGIHMLPKPFAVGVRIEHSQCMIDTTQYGKFAGDPALGAASYKLSHRLDCGRGVYTFCMCPGGTVVGAASEPGGVVTNGMSRYSRALENANSALLVSVTPADFGAVGALAGIEFQRNLEHRAFALGGSNYNAPVQLVGDFLANKPTRTLGHINPSYRPGTTPANLADCLDPFITDALRTGLLAMNKKIAGFAHPEAVLTAVESRSSSPVVIVRDPDGLQASISGIFPCGEGAGYAGGIISAAVDGIRSAEKIMTIHTKYS